MAQVATFGTILMEMSDFPTRHPYSLGIFQNEIERIMAAWIAELPVRILYLPANGKAPVLAGQRQRRTVRCARMADERPWFQLSHEEIEALPVDELALRILVQMGTGSEERMNLLGRIQTRQGTPRSTNQAVVEAWWWLIRKGLIAPDAQNAEDNWWLPTRLGHEVTEREDGLARLRAGERIDIELHPRIADDVRSEFLRGKFEAAVFTAMREVEIAARERSGADQDAYGQALLGQAFGKGGKLIDAASADAEEHAVANLFRGALGAFKNPPSHRRVDFDDPTEAAEIVVLASLLLRILDRLAEH